MTYIHFSKLEPIEAASSCFVPVLLVHGESDTFIGAHHAKEMYMPSSPSSFIKLLSIPIVRNQRYAGDKNLILVEGDHNSMRPRFFYDSVSIFFHNMLLTPEEQGLKKKTGVTSFYYF